jgi:UDP-N-acetyl-D-mannosaminuronic acid transferase (WecB/TagA/CpsF family)
MEHNSISPLPKQTLCRILGLEFFVGTAAEAVDCVEQGGLVVVPAAPALKNMPTDADYRESLLGADLRITDSALMVLIWNAISRDSIPRLSGLEYLVELLGRPGLRSSPPFWVMPSSSSAETNLTWVRGQGIQTPSEFCYIAPQYAYPLQDQDLLTRIDVLRPRHIIVALGGGTQERLGLYLKRNLTYKPAIHCIGAAIGFLSGDQIKIPMWADRLYLGWLLRCASDPKRYVPRYWGARHLYPLMLKYRDQLPAA